MAWKLRGIEQDIGSGKRHETARSRNTIRAWFIGVAGGHVNSVFKPVSCELRFDRRHGGRRRWVRKRLENP